MIPGLVRYLEDLSLHLRLNPLRERQVIREMYTHLEDRVRNLQDDGCTREQAVTEATSKFGKPVAIAHELSHVHSERPWGNALLAAAPYAGVFLLFASHGWRSLPWLCTFLTVSVVMTLIGWWRGDSRGDGLKLSGSWGSASDSFVGRHAAKRRLALFPCRALADYIPCPGSHPGGSEPRSSGRCATGCP